jgi:hypothetical protein
LGRNLQQRVAKGMSVDGREEAMVIACNSGRGKQTAYELSGGVQ